MSTQGPVGSTPTPTPGVKPVASVDNSGVNSSGAVNTGAVNTGAVSTGAVRIPSVTVSTGAVRIVIDPARREDVLFRVRREENHEISAWWMIGAFVGVSAAVIALLNFVPG